jgi:hypothetical protein
LTEGSERAAFSIASCSSGPKRWPAGDKVVASLINQHGEGRNRKSKIGNRKLEIGNQKIRISENHMLEVRKSEIRESRIKWKAGGIRQLERNQGGQR